MSRWTHIILKLAALAWAALLFGFLVFASATTQPSRTAAARADGIVALTDGGQRLAAAGRHLQAQQARRLLISGDNRVVSRAELRRLLNIDTKLFACCVDVGYAAQNTRGNAVETRKWALRHRFESLIVVTASYHMPRSLTELGHLLAAVDLYAHPVVPDRFRGAPWWLDHENTMLLGAEYLKYIPSAAQYGIGRMIDTPDRPERPSVSEQKAVAIQ